MIIKAKSISKTALKWASPLITIGLRLRFNKMIIHEIARRPNHSYLVMCNHFSFWDGFWAVFLSMHTIFKQQKMNGLYFMVLKKQMLMNPWLKYFGCFSISPGRASVSESLSHAAELLSTPGNVVFIYPQGNLESQHVRKILIQDGIKYIVPQIAGDCQLIWSSNLVEYFESLRPSVTFHMLDCGTNKHFDFEELVSAVNRHHQQSISSQIRFTKE